MPDYANAKIYEIICHDTNRRYIGATCCTLTQRLSGHISNHKRVIRNPNLKISKTSSFQIIDGENFDIYLIAAHPCLNLTELNLIEAEYIMAFDCVNIIHNLPTSKHVPKTPSIKNVELCQIAWDRACKTIAQLQTKRDLDTQAKSISDKQSGPSYKPTRITKGQAAWEEACETARRLQILHDLDEQPGTIRYMTPNGPCTEHNINI
jgi:hypothetical protein